MKPPGHNARSLYLLALFQLVGGPLVLLSVILFSKLMVTHSSQHGLKAGVVEALQSVEWKTVTNAFMNAEQDAATNQAPLAPTKIKEVKAKCFAIAQAMLPLQIRELTSTKLPMEWESVIVADWRQAPPNPPPRLG